MLRQREMESWEEGIHLLLPTNLAIVFLVFSADFFMDRRIAL